jgi:hypothetical protein
MYTTSFVHGPQVFSTVSPRLNRPQDINRIGGKMQFTATIPTSAQTGCLVANPGWLDDNDGLHMLMCARVLTDPLTTHGMCRQQQFVHTEATL